MEGRLLVGPGCRRPPAALGHPAQGQHVEADVAHPHRLVQLKLDDGDLLYRALVAQQASAVAAAGDRSQQESLVQLGVGVGGLLRPRYSPVVLPGGNAKLGSTFVAVGPVAPRRLLGQHVYRWTSTMLYVKLKQWPHVRRHP